VRQGAKATIAASGFIYRSSFVMIAVMTVGLIALAFGFGEWVVRRLAGQLGGEPAYAKEIASRIAAGDLSNQIATGRKDKSSVLYALRGMQSGLATTVLDIASSADAIATASAEISMGNLDLSQRTEQQAMALERTASSMEAVDLDGSAECRQHKAGEHAGQQRLEDCREGRRRG
jgi:methyl-accepting chemotaxis protein